MSSEYANRRVLVTGGASGVGRAVASAFHAEGASVLAVDIADQGDAPWETLQADLADHAGVRRVVDESDRAEILVNAHGLLRPQAFQETSPDDFDRTIAVNLRSVFFLCQGLLPAMEAAGWGRVINFSSVVARTGGVTSAAYAAAKAGVIAMTKSLARQYAPVGVTVNAIAPAAIDTPLNAFLTEEQRRDIEKSVPVGRFSQPEEFAGAVLYLSSRTAAYITGATIDINGGWVMT